MLSTLYSENVPRGKTFDKKKTFSLSLLLGKQMKLNISTN
jgi:hypothetical protein